MGILVTLRILRKQTRKKMKLLILSVLVAYALCECPEVKDPECKGSDLRCGQGDTDHEGCPMPDSCFAKNTDGCPDICNQPCDWSTEEQCPTPPDSKGCQRGATCAPKDPRCST